jgi:hypothetical protein
MIGWLLLKLALALEIIYYGKLAILKYVKNKPPAINCPPLTYDQTGIAATRAWEELPTKGDKTQEITKIIQGPEETFQDFVAYSIGVELLGTLNWVLSL